MSQDKRTMFILINLRRKPGVKFILIPIASMIVHLH